MVIELLYNVYSQGLGGHFQLQGKMSVAAKDFKHRFDMARDRFPRCHHNNPVLEPVRETRLLSAYQSEYKHGYGKG